MNVASSNSDVGARIQSLPFWRGAVSLQPLVGGLCNKNFVAQDGAGTYVVRIGRDIPEHGIFQPSVQTAMRSAASLGVAPALLFAEGDLTVSAFIDGRHLRPDDMQDGAVVRALVGRVRELHAGGGAIVGTLPFFWPFQVSRIYARYCLVHKSRLSADMETLSGHADTLERLVAPFTPVFTHNDLVPQNVMLDKRGTLFLIDWDYGAYGHPLFDVAAITANIDEDDEATDRKILECYAGSVSPALAQQFFLFKLIVNLRETLWGAVQELSSKLDEEIVQAGMAAVYPEQEQGYAGYTEMNRKRFDRNLEKFKSLYG